ncbi:hypothetical protein GCM10010168_51130 [Actinoplanes ianthinogenes]|uniref:Uncharacterized protein n=1 Tax=Actinoplanes ianthinogenes TaxID=122358 RepID=A0ABM7M3E1_9ACTN|nr:hypothetical protein [Actinoplanes ianthinogenes]BCJ46164.1 hypothetical protein Aiant_68210 [Actinoplanes ianthinogenes]GGR26720.1 hypothetical protein GCM10010168_51130 [Actinoplanes ianthinogenes]
MNTEPRGPVASPKSAVLFGAGADIGSNLLSLNDPARDGFAITDVVTRHIPSDKALAPLTSMQQLASRMLLADPALLDQLGIDEETRTLTVRGRPVRIHFLDVQDDAMLEIGHFDLAIVATHRDHIRSAEMLQRFRKLAGVVIGVAENDSLPAFYVPLAGADLGLLGVDTPAGLGTEGLFSLGSCQCVGWAAQLRGVLEAATLAGVSELGLERAELDIVHPDTASSSFGTAGVGARREDARDNLRPGFSQVRRSMMRLPGVSVLNTVSLRVLTQPPGYQVSRFFVRADLDLETVRAGFARAHEVLPNVIRTTDIPVGSRAFSASGVAATVLTAPSHLHVSRLSIGGARFTEIVTQAYVHNTVGYCASVLEAGRRLLADDLDVTLLPSLELTA